MTYMSSCLTSSGTNCGHLCVITSSFSCDVCLCSVKGQSRWMFGSSDPMLPFFDNSDSPSIVEW